MKQSPDSISQLQKETPAIKPGVSFSFRPANSISAENSNVRCLWTFGTLGNLEFYFIAFI